MQLLSPQSLFQEKGLGWMKTTKTGIEMSVDNHHVMEFTYHKGCNLPMARVVAKSDDIMVGMTVTDAKNIFGMKGTGSMLMSVADETNQNLTASQRELLSWHQKLGHADMQQVQRLCRTTADSKSSVLQTKHNNVGNCARPLCAACQLGKRGRTNTGKHSTNNKERSNTLKAGDLAPGDGISIDQYVSSCPGCTENSRGREPLSQRYTGGTIFVDHASGYVFVKHQVSLRVAETLQAKQAFEQLVTRWIHGGVSIPTAKDTVCDYKVL
jgi:hypothetical protein